MEKILFITPHLSTGGAPQFLLKKIQGLIGLCDITCVEYDDITGGVLVVQKNKLKELLGEKLVTLNENKFELLDIVKNLDPDVIHLEEMPEYFMLDDVAKQLYGENREYKIIETSHDSSFDINNKKFFPDAFIFVSEYQKRLFSSLDIPSFVVEYPIEKKQRVDRDKSLVNLGLDPSKKHFLNIGLFTPRKNQSEIIEYAKRMAEYDCQFHFVGNHADNFEFYWKPLMERFPSNCKWWGERNDVDSFYNAMDYFLFTSKGFDSDKETNPIVLKEALGWNIPILMYDLPVYLGMYKKYDNVEFMSDDFNENLKKLKSLCNKNDLQNYERDLDLNIYLADTEVTQIMIQSNEPDVIESKISILDADTMIPIYFFKFTFTPGSTMFVIPIANMNFLQETHFSSFLIKFFTLDDKFICAKKLFVKPRESKPEVLSFEYPPFDCTYVNYREMFYEDIYRFCNIDNLDTVVDIGANVGAFSLYMLIKRGCKLIHAVEPTPMAYDKLKLASNHCDGIITHKIAMYSHNGVLNMSCQLDNSAISQVSDLPCANCEIAQISCIKLDTFLKVNNLDSVDLIKIDIEGSEFEVFDAINDDIILKCPRYIVEYHAWDGKHYKLESLVNRFRRLGYKLENPRDPEFQFDHAFFYAEKC